MIRNGNGFELGILYIFFHIINTGINNIPYITLISIIGQILLFLRVFKVPWANYEVCINASAILDKKDYRRLILAVFEHANDMHLYYNMMSYLVKGTFLEKKYGSKNFLCLMLFMALLSTSIDVALCYAFSIWLKSSYLMHACGIGFSGVLHAFKVIIYKETAHLPWGINGLPVASKYIAWIELIIFHILTPDASFIGHLAGILAGILYTNTPVGFIFDMLVSKSTGRPLLHSYR